MPRFEDDDGRSLVLEVVGYQYKREEVDNDFDANWVILFVDAFDGEQRLKLREPAYLSWELVELIEWLRGVADRTGVRSGFSGLEPFVQFEYEPDAEAPVVTVVFGGDRVADSLKVDEFMLTFRPTADELRAFALELEAGAAGVPIRAVQEDGYASKVLAERER